jgi:3-deoxy-D-manno-octulosonic acid (KDO) 8-phosphate synthase
VHDIGKAAGTMIGQMLNAGGSKAKLTEIARAAIAAGVARSIVEAEYHLRLGR